MVQYVITMPLKSLIPKKKREQVRRALEKKDQSILRDPEAKELTREELGKKVTEFRTEFKSGVARLVEKAEERNIAGPEYMRSLNKHVKIVLDALHEIERDLFDQSIEVSTLIDRFEQIKLQSEEIFPHNKYGMRLC